MCPPKRIKPNTVTNPKGETTTFGTDTTGRLNSTTWANSASVGLGYDAAGNLKRYTPPGQGDMGFGYTAADEANSRTLPPLPGVGNESTTYTLAGRVDTHTFMDGSVSVVTRDALARTKAVTTPWWTTGYGYKPTTGQLNSVTRGAQSVTWDFDGFLPTSETTAGASPGVVGWGYDTDFRPATLTVEGTPVPYEWDDDGLLKRAGSLILTRKPATGQLESASLGVVSEGWTYDDYGDTDTHTATVSGAPLFSVRVTARDALGRIETQEETVQGVTTVYGYHYDNVGRLHEALKDGVVVGSWTYDDAGNRLTDNGIISTYDAQQRQKTYGASVTYTHDANGHRQTRTDATGTTTYGFDGMGGLHTVSLPDGTQLEYVLDGLQRRVAKKRNGVVVRRWLYDGQYRVVGECDATGLFTRYIYGTLGHSPDYMVRAGSIYRFVHDHLGSIRLVIDAATGAVAQRLDYDAWGTVLHDTTPSFQLFGYAGGPFDLETRLSHFGFREYDARAGSFLSPEPVLADEQALTEFTRSGSSVAVYVYAVAEPQNHIDPDGWTALNVTTPSPTAPPASSHLLLPPPKDPAVPNEFRWIPPPRNPVKEGVPQLLEDPNNYPYPFEDLRNAPLSRRRPHWRIKCGG